MRDAHAGRGLLQVCLAGVLWGTIGTAIELIHRGSALSPLTMGAYRAVAAVAVLLVASLVTGRLGMVMVVTQREWPRVTAVGVLTAAFQLQFFVAVLAIGVSTATVLSLGSAPVVLLVVTSMRSRHVPSLRQGVTIVTALVGLIFVSCEGSAGGHSTHPLLGVLAAVASGTAYALSAHVGAPLSRRADPLAVTTATMSPAAGVLVPTGLLVPPLMGKPVTTTDLQSWGLLVYLGVVTMALAYGLLFAGLRSTPSGSAVIATLLEPVTAVLLAVVVLHDALTPIGVVGSLLIFAAIGSLSRQPVPQPQ